MGKVGKEDIKSTIKTLHARGTSNAMIAGFVGLSPSTVGYHVKRIASGALDGRHRPRSKAVAHSAAISMWRKSHEGRRCNLSELHAFLVREHGFDGSLRSVQRYCRKENNKIRVRSYRRVETPPGVQAQIDWAEFRRIQIGGKSRTLYAFHVLLSHSRKEAIVWSLRKDMLAWIHCHVEGFNRLGGVPATARVDNEKTVVSRGAGSWGEFNPTYRLFAQRLRFHIDACSPGQPQRKGKVERRVRNQRDGINPYSRRFSSLQELQAWTDAGLEAVSHKRLCPPKGTSIAEAWAVEKDLLTPLPDPLPEAFDVAVQRKVSLDSLVSFEGRQYSVPYRHVGLVVEVRGTANKVQVLGSNDVIAEHPRGGSAKLYVVDSHYDAVTGLDDRVIAPPPLGKMGVAMRAIASVPEQHRSIQNYQALANIAR